MKTEIQHVVSIQDILRSYSGRRLQYAIRLGIMPTPESLKQFLKRKENTGNGIKKWGDSLNIKPTS